MHYVYHVNRPRGTLSQQYVVNKYFNPGLFIGLAIDVATILAVKHFLEPGQETVYLPIFALVLSFGGAFIGLKKLKKIRAEQLESFQNRPGNKSRAYARFLEDEIQKGYGIGFLFRKMPAGYNLQNDPPVIED